MNINYFYLLLGVFLYFIFTRVLENFSEKNLEQENFDPSLVPVSSIITLAKVSQTIANGNGVLTNPNSLQLGSSTNTPGNLIVNGPSTFNGDVTVDQVIVTKPASINTLNVTGDTTIDRIAATTSNVLNNARINTLTTDTLTISDNITINNTGQINGNSSISTLNVNGNVNNNGNLSVNGDTTLSDLSVNGSLRLNNKLIQRFNGIDTILSNKPTLLATITQPCSFYLNIFYKSDYNAHDNFNIDGYIYLNSSNKLNVIYSYLKDNQIMNFSDLPSGIVYNNFIIDRPIITTNNPYNQYNPTQSPTPPPASYSNKILEALPFTIYGNETNAITLYGTNTYSRYYNYNFSQKFSWKLSIQYL